MIVPRPELISITQTLPLNLTNPLHMSPVSVSGRAISELGEKIGTEAVTRFGTFEDVMLKALDQVSGDQQTAETLMQAAIVNPNSVDAHDVTIAQAKATMSLTITRTVLNRVVQSWKDIINTR
ncbi:hypothetical protein FACS1894172_20780 [Spirochaetia bacterium]|nr:hypothetical protein FACS1894164_01690 [Spirochaetia bacterium]GHU37390.1 hypothetical protein FACS1894172_20780 [Spirochaetia bacterium]